MEPSNILKMVREQRKRISDSFSFSSSSQMPKYTKNDDNGSLFLIPSSTSAFVNNGSISNVFNSTTSQMHDIEKYLLLAKSSQSQIPMSTHAYATSFIPSNELSRCASVKSVASDSGLGSSSPLSDCSDYSNSTQTQTVLVTPSHAPSRKRKSCANIYDELVSKYQVQMSDTNMTRSKSLRTHKSTSPHGDTLTYPLYHHVPSQQTPPQHQQQATQDYYSQLYNQQYSLAMLNQALALQQQSQSQHQQHQNEHVFKSPYQHDAQHTSPFKPVLNESTEAYINKFLRLNLNNSRVNQEQQQQHQANQKLVESSANTNDLMIQLKQFMSEHTNTHQHDDKSSLLLNQLSTLIENAFNQQKQVSNDQSSSINETDIPVTISKKMLPIVTSRIHDWLVKSIDFSLGLCIKNQISVEKIQDLLIKAWPRLLLVHMMENSFDFCVTKDHQSSVQAAQQHLKITNPHVSQDLLTNHTYLQTIALKLPKERDVKQLHNLITKGFNLSLTCEEYNELREIILFKESDDACCAKASLNAQKRLKQLIELNHANNKQLFSRLLLFLPSIYNVKTEIISNLFCRNLKNSKDVFDLIMTKTQLFKVSLLNVNE